MSVKNDIKNSILGIINTSDSEIYSILCKVAFVDMDSMTCDCVPIDTSKPNILDVKLIVKDEEGKLVNGFVVIPKVDSLVVVTMLSNEDGHVTMFSAVEEIQLNGKNFGGLIKIEKLVDKVNALENLVNNLLTTLKNTSITLAPSGTYPFAPLYAAFNSISPITNKSDLENTTVNHGDGTQ